VVRTVKNPVSWEEGTEKVQQCNLARLGSTAKLEPARKCPIQAHTAHCVGVEVFKHGTGRYASVL